MKRQKGLKLAGKEVISLDIGQHSIQMVVGKPGMGSIDVKHAISLRTPKGCYEKGRITDMETLKNSIGTTLDSLKIRTKTALCVVESSEIITREVLLPAAEEEQIEKMLAFEIQQYMPIELDDYMVQSKVLEEVVEGGVAKSRVLVTAVPKDLSRTYYDLIKSLSLQPTVFDIESNALDKLIASNFLINGDDSIKEHSVAVLDIGYSHLNVIVFEKGHYKFNRFINQGSQSIDQNLVSFMDVSFDDAEKLKSDIAHLNKEFELPDELLDPSEPQAQKMRVLNIVRNTVDSWVDDIDRIFKYYTTRGMGNSIEQIYLYGGSSRLKGLDEYLQDAFGIPTSCISSLTNVNIGQYTGDAALGSYINALGTMIRR